MKIKKILIIFFLFLISLAFFFFIYSKLSKKKTEFKKELNTELTQKDDPIYNSNIIKDVYYTSKDAEGNEYIITASEGEIDYSNSNVLYLTNVKGLIKLKDSDDITITSNYGRYNTDNFDTIFSKNVIINYLDNKITGEYLDFSIERNSMIVSREVVYTNLKNILKADAVEINLKTKDTKIFMYEENKKVNIRNKKYPNGNN